MGGSRGRRAGSELKAWRGAAATLSIINSSVISSEADRETIRGVEKPLLECRGRPMMLTAWSLTLRKPGRVEAGEAQIKLPFPNEIREELRQRMHTRSVSQWEQCRYDSE